MPDFPEGFSPPDWATAYVNAQPQGTTTPAASVAPTLNFGPGIDLSNVDYSGLGQVMSDLQKNQQNLDNYQYGWSGFTPAEGAITVGPVSFDPSVWSGPGGVSFARDVTSSGGLSGAGLQGAQFAEGYDPAALAVAQKNADYEVQKNLSSLLKNNQFSEAVQYAQQNNVLDKLAQPDVLRNLRQPFTKDEAAAFLQAMPSKIGGWDYNPNQSISSTLSKWDSSTGYPDPTAGLYQKEDLGDKLIKGGAISMLALGAGAAAGSLLGLGGLGAGASGTLATAEAAAVKAAAGNAIMTAIQGGDIGDILKSAAVGGLTGGITSAAAPALFSELSSVLPPDIAKAVTNGVVSAGIAEIRGGDPLQAAFVSGMGSYIGSISQDAANNLRDYVDPKLAQMAASAAGSAGMAALVGADPLAAAGNQIINQTANQVLGYAGDKFKELFPDAASTLSDIKNQISDYIQSGKDHLGEALSGTTGGDGLQEISVTANRSSPYDFSALDALNQSLQPYRGQPSTQPPAPQPSAPMEEVSVAANRTPEDFSAIDALNQSLQPYQQPQVAQTQPQNVPVEQPPLEEVAVTSNKIPEDFSALDALNQQAQQTSGGLAEVVVSGQRPQQPPPETPIDLLPVTDEIGVTAKRDTGAQVAADSNKLPVTCEIEVTGKQPITGLGCYAFNPIGQTCMNTTAANIDLPVSVKGGSGNVVASANVPQSAGQFNPYWLDTSAQMLGYRQPGQTISGAKLGELKQIFASMTPELQGALVDRGYGPTGGYQGFAGGGSADSGLSGFSGFLGTSGGSCCFHKVCSNYPVFSCCGSDLLTSPNYKKHEPLTLAKLAQIKQSISPYGSGISPYGPMGGMAKGGLPQEYHQAAPDGHNPEFITGLTGYYAQGGGTGQSDDIPAMLHDGDYVMDADTVAALGDGSSKAGAEVLEKFRKQVPYRDGGAKKPVPAKIADGEYVFPAAFVTALGGGDNKQGSKILDGMRERLRAHKRSAPTSKIPPKAKSPLDYLKGAKG